MYEQILERRDKDHLHQAVYSVMSVTAGTSIRDWTIKIVSCSLSLETVSENSLGLLFHFALIYPIALTLRNS